MNLNIYIDQFGLPFFHFSIIDKYILLYDPLFLLSFHLEGTPTIHIQEIG